MKKNIFWTGGFDSTFRLLQLICDDEISEINIYYITLFIDNIKYSLVGRRSVDIELKTMLNILLMLNTSKIKKFNIIGKSEDLLTCSFMFNFDFMNYICKEEVTYSDKIKIYYFDLFANDFVNRPISQYTYISEILEELNIEADICLEYNPDNPRSFYNLVSKVIVNNKISHENNPELKAFSRYNLPIISLTKEDMLEISINNGWCGVLEITWSCWYPYDNRPCNNCFACKRRVI
jgi:hypothetical protein